MKIVEVSGSLKQSVQLRHVVVTFYFDDRPDREIEEELGNLLPDDFFSVSSMTIKHYGPDGMLISSE